MSPSEAEAPATFTQCLGLVGRRLFLSRSRIVLAVLGEFMDCLGDGIEGRIDRALERFPYLDVIILFGSVGSGTASFGSDMDIAVQSDRPLEADQRCDIIDALALEFGRAVDLIDLNVVGQPLLHQIISTGTRVRGSNSDWGRLIYRNILENEDFAPLQQRILDERLKQWIDS